MSFRFRKNYNEPVSASYKKCQLDRLTVPVGRGDSSVYDLIK